MSKYAWYPNGYFLEESNVAKLMEELEIRDYRELVNKTIEDYEWFWDKINELLGIHWFENYKTVMDDSKGPMWTKWYRGGLLNVTYNAIDKHYHDSPESKAFIWSGENGEERIVSYRQVYEQVNRLSYALLNTNVKKGDAVALYMPMLPETVYALLAPMRIGAIAEPIFSGFGVKALEYRLIDSRAKVLITVDGFYRRGKNIILVENALQAAQESKHIEKIVVVNRLGIGEKYVKESENIVLYNDYVRDNVNVTPEPLDPETPAMLMYTSGTTGKPKGVITSHAGAALMPAKDQLYNFDVKKGDVFFWVTDIGWMMGPWQIIGIQVLGSTHLLMEGAPDYPSPDRIWSLVEKYKVTQLGLSATLIRMLRRLGDQYVESHDLSSLKTTGNTGEPIDESSWWWLLKVVGNNRVPIINISGGTELFGPVILPSPAMPLKPSTVGFSGLGCDTDVFDEKGNPVRGEMGYFVVKKPIPSMTRGLWGDPERYIETYWSRYPGVWYHGDWALIDEDGHYFVFGRADDVIKVAGKRIGPAEVESAANSHPSVSESAAIGVPDELKGETIVLFVVPKQNVIDKERVAGEILNHVVSQLGKAFSPSGIYFVRELPKTRSGKIMRRLIREAFVTGEIKGDVSSLENPGSLEEIIRIRNSGKDS